MEFSGNDTIDFSYEDNTNDTKIKLPDLESVPVLHCAIAFSKT